MICERRLQGCFRWPQRIWLEHKTAATWTDASSPIKARYGWLSHDTEEFVTEIDVGVSPTEQAWLLGLPDFLGTTSSAFKWNEWEKQSLDAADGDFSWITSITSFWDTHFPIMFSVKNGYACFAVQKSDFSVVCGEEPEFEETAVIASSFLEFLNRLAASDPALARWF